MTRVLLAAAFIGAGLLHGTAFAEAYWAGGLKVGANFANATGEDADLIGSDRRTGFAGGAFVQRQFDKAIALRIEGLYMDKGAEATLDIFGAAIKGTAKFSYIEFPALLVFTAPVGETVAFNFFAGPALAFNVGAELEARAEGLFGKAATTVDIKDGVKTTDFGGVLGVALSFETGAALVSFETRWTRGFSTVDDGIATELGSPVPYSTDVKHTVISVMIGITRARAGNDSVSESDR